MEGVRESAVQVLDQFLCFVLGGETYGIPILKVREIQVSAKITRIPQAPEAIPGVINLRGQIVTAIDVRARFGLPPRTGDDLPMNVVVRTDEGVVSLLVDEIGDVLEVDEAAFERVPETLLGTIREHVRGVYKLDVGLLLLLDAERVTNLLPTRKYQAS